MLLSTSTPARRNAPASVAVRRCTRTRDRAQTVGPVIRRVQAGDHRQQHLGRADVARGLLAPDVLLTGLEREPQRAPSLRVDRYADQASRQRTLVPVAGGDVGRVGPAEPERDPIPLGVADDDIGADLPRRPHEHECEQIRSHRDERALRVQPLDQRSVVTQRTARAWILQEHTEHAVARNVRIRIAHDDGDVERLGTRRTTAMV